jgi:hypothetical protein
MGDMRQSIIDGSFAAFRAHVHEIWPESTEPAPVAAWGSDVDEPFEAPAPARGAPRPGGAKPARPPARPGPRR